jgi:hypothetical protein
MTVTTVDVGDGISMAYYDHISNKILRVPPKDSTEYPGWEIIDCFCCNGLEFTCGYTEIECKHCAGQGSYFRHKESRAIAIYPGGPFLGKDT